MLDTLSIKNYALIDELHISFDGGFNVITGETGAGKSILLGALSLVLGKRADLSSLRDQEKKCVIEAEFAIDKYALKDFFKENDLEYEGQTIIRREILASGKSRAFINDSPVTLGVLSALGTQLLDIHSQHQTLELTENDFQLRVIDAVSGNHKLLEEYRGKLKGYQKLSKQLQTLLDNRENANKEHDYNSFLLKELEEASLSEGIQEELEEQFEQLNNVEIIIEQLSKGHQLLNDEQIGVVALLSELKQMTSKLNSFGSHYQTINERVQSVFIEIDDIAAELESTQEGVEANPQLLEQVNTKLQLIYDLQKKHQVASVEELIVIKNDLAEKVSVSENIDADIEAKQKEVAALEKELDALASEIHKKRAAHIPSLKKQIEEKLSALGMLSATFKIEVQLEKTFKPTGKDQLVFLFCANKGGSYGELKKVASGGELSRIMLTIKSILAKYDHLPTIMFDEIDTGVSGEISHKMGDIMFEMSKSMQVFSITHLPQVASKGNHHYKVYKQETDAVTHTNIKQLSKEERITELAEMLGGKSLSDSAIAHAKQLLN